MGIEERYRECFESMKRTVETRRKNHLLTALGYTSNLDLLCEFRTDVLSRLLEEYLPGRSLAAMEAAEVIRNMEDFLCTVVAFCRNGIGGEVEIEDFCVIEDHFQVKHAMGGTAVQGALALSAVGCPCLVHLTDDSKEVCEQLRQTQISTVSPEGELIEAASAVQQAEQEIHYIIQFQKGELIRLGDECVTIPVSNRLIITKITVNESVPLSEPYLTYVEKKGAMITSNLISSFNVIKDIDVLKCRLERILLHVEKYREKNPEGIVYYEDAHYHQKEIKELCLNKILPSVDVVSMNEEELSGTMKLCKRKSRNAEKLNGSETEGTEGLSIQESEGSSIIKMMEDVRFLITNYKIQGGVVVHSKDFAMYVGKKKRSEMEAGLIMGNLLAAAKAKFGSYGTYEQLACVMELPLSPDGRKALEIIEEKGYDDVILVPSKYMDKPRYTIGLGDSFTAGVQLCFGGEGDF